MLRPAVGCMFAVALLLPTATIADPIALKLSFFTSDQSVAYQAAVKPFVDAVNHDGNNLLHIDVYLSGDVYKRQIRSIATCLSSTRPRWWTCC